MALTPPELLQAHLQLDQRVVDALRPNKTPIVPA
jgi:oxalate decarboxylase